MRIIGLTGLARSGKDTVGQIIKTGARPDEVIKTTGFAHLLKLSAARLFKPDCDLAWALAWSEFVKEATAWVSAWDDAEGYEEISGRVFLQRYGTEAHRDVFGQDFWLDAVLPSGRSDCNKLVITDVRFENEAQRIQDHGGRVWKIERPGVEVVAAHASEAGIPAALVDLTIVNDGTIDDLRGKVLEAL